MTLAWLLLALLLAGCALRVATNGPVTVVLGPAERIAWLCRGFGGGPRVSGCLVWEGTRVTIYCGHAGVERCVAHEVRHIVEPQWRHD